MTDGRKDLAFYEANPEQLPTDPQEIEALMAQLESGGAGGQAGENSTERAVQGANGGAGEEEGEGFGNARADASGLELEAPVASKDGRHTIPYNVLATEREKRRAAEQAMRALQDQLSVAQADQGGGAGFGDGFGNEFGDVAVDELALFAEDFPAVKGILDRTRRIEAQLDSVRQQVAQEDERRQLDEMALVRAAVDANPVLLYWEHHDPDRWQAAVEADQRLQFSPAHRGLTLEERLAKAVEVVDAFYGPDDAVARLRQETAARPVARRQVERQVGAGRPRTLSDIPGGAVPGTDPLEEFTSLSAEQLGARMAGMNPDQIDALLARLG